MCLKSSTSRREDDARVTSSALPSHAAIPPDLCCYGECHCTPGASRVAGRAAFWALGWSAVAMAVAGLILPMLPATPFALIAAWAFARASPRLEDRLRSHPRLGPLLAGWRERRAIPRRAKVLAVLSLLLSWIVLAALGRSTLILIVAGAFMLAVAVWILTRNE